MATFTITGQVKLRNDTSANWALENPTLSQGEMGIETDTLKAKVGDGVTTWNSLEYMGSQYSLVGHTHNYAGSSSVGGSATSVVRSAGTTNSARHVWFSDANDGTGTVGKCTYDNDFKYNPSTNVLTVGSITGSAGSVAWNNVTGKPTIPTVPLKTSDLTFSGVGLSGSVDAVTGAKIDAVRSIKSFGLPANAITVEYSNDGGQTWVDYELTDAEKMSLFTGVRAKSICCGKKTTAGTQTTNDQVRVTIIPTDRYCSFNGIYVWMSTSGNTCVMDLEYSTIGAK